MSDAFEAARDLVRALPGHDLWTHQEPSARLALAGKPFAIVHRRAPGARLRVVARFSDIEAVLRWAAQAPPAPRR